MTFKAILLDVYDTVLVAPQRPREAYEFVLTELSARLGTELEDVWVRDQLIKDRKSVMTQEVGISEYVWDNASIAHTPQQLDEIIAGAQDILAAHKAAYHPRPEYKEFLALAEAYKLKLCLGSNLALPYVDHVKEKLPEIDHKVFSCHAHAMKPQKAFFMRCAREMGVRPDEMIMIGNSRRNDVKAAKNAGFMNAFWLSNRITMFGEYKANNGITKLTDIFSL